MWCGGCVGVAGALVRQPDVSVKEVSKGGHMQVVCDVVDELVSLAPL